MNKKIVEATLLHKIEHPTQHEKNTYLGALAKGAPPFK